MSVLVTGSIAIDHIMVFRDRFRNHILPERVHLLNVSFHVPTLQRNFGGTAGNIAYNLSRLGVAPVLLATVGCDFGDYAGWLDRCGIRRDWLRALDDALTAQAYIITDLEDNQITAFHPGAMDRAHEAGVECVDEPYQLAIVSPNGKRAMLEHAAALKRRGTPLVVDPGQALPILEADEIRGLLEGAALYIVNDYEWSLTRQKTGFDEVEVARRAGALVVTRGEHGSTLFVGERRIEIPPVRAERVVDPTGCGDAYRAGLLFGRLRGLSWEVAGRIASLLGSLKVERSGPQSIELGLDEIRARYAREFGSGF
jgi:adenosine kinase